MFIQKQNLPQRIVRINSNNLTLEQQHIYKSILCSKRGIEVLNKLKNEALLKDTKSLEWYNLIFKFLKPKIRSKVDKLFLSQINNKTEKEINLKSFNRMSFKELNITKQDILQEFRKYKLINF